MSILDQEDEMLYGEATGDDITSEQSYHRVEAHHSQANTTYSYSSQAENNYWICVIRNKLHLEVFIIVF